MLVEREDIVLFIDMHFMPLLLVFFFLGSDYTLPPFKMY